MKNFMMKTLSTPGSLILLLRRLFDLVKIFCQPEESHLHQGLAYSLFGGEAVSDLRPQGVVAGLVKGLTLVNPNLGPDEPDL